MNLKSAHGRRWSESSWIIVQQNSSSPTPSQFLFGWHLALLSRCQKHNMQIQMAPSQGEQASHNWVKWPQMFRLQTVLPHYEKKNNNLTCLGPKNALNTILKSRKNLTFMSKSCKLPSSKDEAGLCFSYQWRARLSVKSRINPKKRTCVYVHMESFTLRPLGPSYK